MMTTFFNNNNNHEPGNTLLGWIKTFCLTYSIVCFGDVIFFTVVDILSFCFEQIDPLQNKSAFFLKKKKEKENFQLFYSTPMFLAKTIL